MNPSPERRSYAEKLKDARWQELRLRLFEAADWTCEECKSIRPSDGLQVHHIIYLAGVEPWDHPPEVLLSLCDKCHVERQEIEREFYLKIAKVIRNKSIEELKTFPVWYMFETEPLKIRKEAR